MFAHHTETWVWGLLGLSALAIVSCGKPNQEDADIHNGKIPVEGAASVGTQCDYGSIQAPLQLKVGLWDCPIENPALAVPPPALLLKGDCKKRELSIRSAENLFEPSTWLVYPDHTFYATIDTVPIMLADDGTGQGKCMTYAKMRISDGYMKCKDRNDPLSDQLTIQGDLLWYLDQGIAPQNSEIMTGVRSCALPAGCYLSSRLKIDQC